MYVFISGIYKQVTQVTMKKLYAVWDSLQCFILKEQSRPSISNVKCADIRLATGIITAMSLVNVRIPSKTRDGFFSRNSSMKQTRLFL